MTELTQNLTNTELGQLAAAEGLIERGLKTFTEVGMALTLIRDKRLYRADFETFEAYCSQRWQISRPRAYELMTAAEVVSAMADTNLPAPTNERQARELARVPEAQRAEVWRETIERTEGKPTAAAIRETVAPTVVTEQRSERTPVGQSPTQIPARQPVADAILKVVDDHVATTAVTAEVGLPLDFNDIAADTVQRWRLNFATARLKARELTTFDPERINEVHSGNWDREVGDILGALEAWIAQVRDARRDQQRTKLRLVGGGRA